MASATALGANVECHHFGAIKALFTGPSEPESISCKAPVAEGIAITLLRPGSDRLPWLVSLDGYEIVLKTSEAGSILVHSSNEIEDGDEKTKRS